MSNQIPSISIQDRIHQCILNINIKAITILGVREQRNHLNIPENTPIYDDILFSNITKICSILEELKILRSLCKQDEYLKDVLYCVKPIVDYIRQYEKGFALVRNSMVAHFQRDKMGNYEPYWERLDGLHIPRDNNEHEFIYDCIDVLRVVLIDRFPDFKNFHHASHKNMCDKVDAFKETFKPKPAIEVDTIKQQINQRLVEKGFQKSNGDFFIKMSRPMTGKQ
jgi:hypothetical protein